MRILELRVRDFACLEAIDITPGEQPMVVLTGPNAAGKSTALSAIEAALAGKDALPEVPIRAGATKASLSVALGDASGVAYRVERRVSPGGSYLRVFDHENKPIASPQRFLDSLTATGLAFDPAAWLRMSAKDQTAALLKAGGVDLAGLESRRKEMFDERRGVGRDVGILKARLGSMPPVAGIAADAVEMSVTDLAQELAEMQRTREANDGERRKARGAADAARRADEYVERCAAEVAATEGAIEELRQKLATQQAALAAARSAAFEAEARETSETERVAALVDPDPTPVTAKIAGAEEHNRRVRAARERADVVRDLDIKTREAEGLTKALEDLDIKQRRLVEGMALGLPELGVSAAGVTYKGFPLAQASQAEQVRVSLAVGLRGGQLRVVLVRDGAHLDPAGLRLVAEYAAAQGAQVWIERPDTGAKQDGFRIVDGKVEA